MASKKAIGAIIILIIIAVVVMFGGGIFPTTISEPVQFDVTQPQPQPVPSTGDTGRSCLVYPNDPGC